MALIRDEAPADVGAREALLDRSFGPARFGKTCERLREGRIAADGLSLVAEGADGAVIGTLRFWHVALGQGRPALMLGPLAVSAEARNEGLGARLMQAGLARAETLGHEAVILVGDEPYYRRFGFGLDATEKLVMPGPVERQRFLGLALKADAFAGAEGLVRATGAVALPVRRTGVAEPRRAA
jgi:predicted N-acetyltransferase YhbS